MTALLNAATNNANKQQYKLSHQCTLCPNKTTLMPDTIATMYLNQVWDTAQKSLETTQSPCSGLLWSSAAERCSAVCLTGRRGKPQLWCQHHADVEPLCHTPPYHTNTDTVIYTHHSHLPQLVALSCLHPQQGSNAAMSNCHGHHYCHAVAITHTHTHPFNGPFSETTQVSRYQKSRTNLDFTEARDREWQWHQLDHNFFMQVYTSFQTGNHASTSPLSFLQAGCPSCHPTNNVKALKANNVT